MPDEIWLYGLTENGTLLGNVTGGLKHPKQKPPVKYNRADLNEWQPIETAPNNKSILVYARWDWDGMDRPSDEYEAVVAWSEGGSFWSETNNPYTDKAYKPTHWMPLPKPPKGKNDE